MTDITTTWIIATGTGDWSIAGGALASGNDLASAVLISLFTDRQADADDVLPDGSDDRRGWWGDAGAEKSIGSRLWLLDRSRLNQDVCNTAKVYIVEALQWVIDDQVAARVDVSTAINGRSRMDVLVTLTRADGSRVPLQYSWVWS